MSAVRARCVKLAALTDCLLDSLLNRAASDRSINAAAFEAFHIVHSAFEVERTRLELIEEDDEGNAAMGFKG